MTSRRRGANSGNSSPVVTSNSSPVVTRTYDLRGGTKNVYQQSSVSTDPQTPEPGSKGDSSGLGRPFIKNSGKETKDRPVDQDVKTKFREPSRRAPEPVEPDADSDSDDGSSDNSRRGLSENDRQSHLLPTIPSSESSAKWPPSQPRPSSKYIEDKANVSLVRPPIGSSYDSAKKQSSQVRQPIEDAKVVEEKRLYWRDSKMRHSQSSSEDDKEEIIQDRQKPKGTRKDQLNERTRYNEEKATWRSTDRREVSDIHHRYPQKPKVNTGTQLAWPKAHHGFSDDEEAATRYQRKEAFLPRQNKINHNPQKEVEQKGNLLRKPRTNFFRCFAACMKYVVLALVVLVVGSAAVFYVSPETIHKLTDQMKFLGGPEVKKDLKDDFGNLTSIFTNQSPLMWKRSRLILERHLENWKGSTEPAIILLAGARDAEQTLLCIGTQLADIYSSSLSGNYTVISGSDWASGSNEEVKAYIDDHLSARFQATARAAVLHRLELLPAGSLLILYKYCDHESAVFKNVMLLFTVLLDDATLAKDVPLNLLEETVRAFLIQKLIDSDSGASHDGMDNDKFSGVWSRISHVVLPVFPEKKTPEQCVKIPI